MSDTTSSYYYTSATSTTTGTETTGHRFTTTSHTDPSGNTIVRTAHQDLGEPAVIEERRYDRTGQELVSTRPGTGSGISGEGASSVDTSTNQNLSLLDTSLSSFRSQDTNVSATNTPADDISGSYQSHHRSDFDEGAIDPVTGKVYHAED
ncbi:hypothetical protein UA08_00037 [Talaromyces atroroseus]|uniref:Uncharacterized protein n=1 Tax=Talaromyces atroroseus TaxID=1441469 RepID=A0A225AZ86_TALAT|nr:hypothetical protein UA08_00037 [Talaromyces atroroseus]OKL63764.1 hypothetical protein UA08_00037 [Talaromyces atroroseus]